MTSFKHLKYEDRYTCLDYAASNLSTGELRNETIGFIFQFHRLLPEFIALVNVLMPYVIENGKASAEVVILLYFKKCKRKIQDYLCGDYP